MEMISLGAPPMGDDECDADALGSSAYALDPRASEEKQNPKHPKDFLGFVVAAADVEKCVAAYASNGSRASWTAAPARAGGAASSSEAAASAAGSGGKVFRSVDFFLSRDVRAARSLNDPIPVPPRFSWLAFTPTRFRSTSA